MNKKLKILKENLLKKSWIFYGVRNFKFVHNTDGNEINHLITPFV